MSLDNRYLEYPKRSYGHDHDRFEWSMLSDRPAITWPGGKRLAVWINTSLQFFPLNQQGKPFKVPNGLFFEWHLESEVTGAASLFTVTRGSKIFWPKASE